MSRSVSPNPSLVPLKRTIPRTGVVDDWLRIPSCLSLALGTSPVRVVNCFSSDVLQLRHPLADVVTGHIEFLTLQSRVEYSGHWQLACNAREEILPF